MPFSGSAAAELAFLFAVTILTPNLNFIMPFRPILVILALSTHLPFVWVGLIASVGATLGALPIYYASAKVRDLTKVQAWLHRHSKWQRVIDRAKRSPFLTILLLLWTPVPDQLVGLYGGLEKYPIWRYILANFIGRAVWYVPLAYIGSISGGTVSAAWHTVTRWVGW